MKLRSAALSDIGKVRSENEDRFMCEDAMGLYGIADGIGGLPGGAEAASCAVGVIKAGLLAGVTDLIALTQTASEAVAELGHELNPSSGIGSTLSFGVFKGTNVQLSHVGDSRAYLLRDGKFQMLTEDHNVENEMRNLVARGEPVQFSNTNRQALTRCIGQPGLPKVDLEVIPVLPGDRFFFTTDGITRMIPDDELGQLLAFDSPPQAIIRTIIDLALQRGGYDNITGVVVMVDEV